MIDSIIKMFDKFFEIMGNVSILMSDTVKYLDAVQFDDSDIFDYLGYVRYFMGDLNYAAFTSLILIGLGLSVWSYSLRAIGFIKDSLPFV